ncbi:MAG: methyltransferase domain-containing protein [Elusimicrobia bacterium]|nr:methyltransferase domain-containing protein [Elusimicrobiota bacterium]
MSASRIEMKPVPRYTPGLSFHFLTGLYDLFFSWFMPEREIRRAILNGLNLNGEERVLDLGCGTGTLAVHLARTHPLARLSGIDIDPRMLRQAETKSKAARVSLDLRPAGADRLPFDGESFDAVYSSMAFHHFPPDVKRGALRESGRVLKEGGRLMILDFGKPSGWLASACFFAAQCFDGFQTTRENRRGAIPLLMKEAGFANVRQTGLLETIFGTLALYRGDKMRGQ